MRPAISASVLVALSCTPNSGGMGATGDLAPTPDSGSTGSPSAEATDTEATDIDGAQSRLDTDGVDTESADSSADIPQVSIEGTGSFDFGAISVGETTIASLTLRNNGATAANALGANPLPLPFGYAGTGSFPGTGGNCAFTLGPGEACIIALAFTPSGLGPHDGALVLTVDGDAVLDHPLRGAGVGASDNLLSNAGGEAEGSPPPSWVPMGTGAWATGMWDDVAPFEGNRYLHAYDGSTQDDFELAQSVDLLAWIPLVDADGLYVEFTGRVRSYAVDNDEYRIRVQALDGDEAPITSWAIPWQTRDQWQEHAIRQPIPAGARSLRVVLECRIKVGDYCDAYFDALELRVGTR